MASARKIRALIRRELVMAMKNKGRFVGEVVVPLVSIIIWGMVSSAGIFSKEAATLLISIQIVWTLVYTFQSYTNVSMMYDIWAREIGNLLPEVSIMEYIVSKAAASFIVVIFIAGIILSTLLLAFNAPVKAILLSMAALPSAWLFSVSISMAVFGIIIAYGRTYDFLSWSIMSFIIFLSFPFSVPQNLEWVTPLSSLLPLFHTFSYLRGEGSLLLSYASAIIWLLCCFLFMILMYRKSLKSGMLAEMSL